MTCIECGKASEAEVCATCAREDAMYAAYRESIDVPPLWSRIEERIRPRLTFNIQHSTFNIAAATAIAVLLLAAMVLLLRDRRPDTQLPATEAAMHYRASIAKLHAAPASPLFLKLNAAVNTAERAAARAPSDPVEITRLVAAYDAKLQFLRVTAND